MQVSPARRAAFEILRRVEAEGAYSSSLLAQNDDRLRRNDRALAHELVLGVLRRRLWLDQSLEHFANRKIADLDLPVILALRLGLYQLRFLTRIPASAAINESVNLVKVARVKSAATFVNAVLRRATREVDYNPAANATDEIEKLAIEASHPRWLIERWSAQFGIEEATAIARANNDPAPLAFRFTARAFRDSDLSPTTIVEQLRTTGAELIESKIAPDGWRMKRLDRTREGSGQDAGEPQAGIAALKQLSADGLIYFQDEASQLVAHLIAVQVEDRVLDVCAAPGSKSTLMAALAPRANIVAGDFYEHRARTIKEFAKQQAVDNIEVMVHDATRSLPFENQTFDRVLVDAPCSGTGTLRHNPEIRWRLQALDIRAMAEKQELILKNAATTVSAGGVLIYSTCSLEPDENEAVIADFLAEHRDFQIVAFNSPSSLLSDAGTIRTWPHRDDVEGFFAAALRRNG
ncbi:MAG: 16S rRNA (cytosine(967)-C(5))-methyltransferase RsmB [Acidobacteria bacterium]|nr:MAG: 16S rRNA (cytosine(967)-C(5))-methyltransferase RsmB [Acidobacteriota bacterium]